MFSAEGNGNEQNIRFKFRYENALTFNLSSYMKFYVQLLLKAANVNIYVRHNYKSHEKTEAHYSGK
jgi:hypothetical protein